MSETKAFIISKNLVLQGYKAVKASAGASGIDKQSLKDFDDKLEDNLYKIWNRLSSGSYMPSPVRTVSIPKKSGGERLLGIPTVTDRIAQMVVKLTFEPFVEPVFHQDSYGYRPNKSAIDAIGVTRKRCWKYNFVLEFDIRGMFDNIDHELLMKAVRKHTENKWVILYIERWLKADVQDIDGKLVKRTRGIPQGGVISPLLSNLFLHYVFDVWMVKNHPELPFCRYADDGLVHCSSEKQAQVVLVGLKKRFEVCSLELHPEKTNIVYCKDANRTGEDKHINTCFDFLGYTFRGRISRGEMSRGDKGNKKTNVLFMNFTPGVSKTAIKSMRRMIRRSALRNRTEQSLNDIAKWWNPIIRGWIGYYGVYNKWAMYPVLRHFNLTLVKWAKHKYKRLKSGKIRASKFMMMVAERDPKLFVHWKLGMVGTFI